MTVALNPREDSYRLSASQRRANDLYPTPSDLAISLALGLPRMGPGLVAPMRTHSEKPNEFYALVERVCPAPRYCELFSRRGRPNWMDMAMGIVPLQDCARARNCGFARDRATRRKADLWRALNEGRRQRTRGASAADSRGVRQPGRGRPPCR